MMSSLAPPRRLCATIILAVLVAAATPLGAQQGRVGLIVVAHGADSSWNSRVEATAAAVDWPHGPVHVAYLMGPSAVTMGLDTALEAVGRDGAVRAIAVPLLMSSHSGHYRQILEAIGQTDAFTGGATGHAHAPPTPPRLPIAVTRALDDAPELGQALSRRWRDLDSAARAASLMFVAHGPNSDREAALWRANLERVIHRLPPEALLREIRMAQLRDDAPPEVRAAAIDAMRDTILALAARSGDSVTVLPALISAGQITAVKIPRDLDGLPIRYRPTVLAPAPELARWIERVAAETLAIVDSDKDPAAPARNP